MSSPRGRLHCAVYLQLTVPELLRLFWRQAAPLLHLKTPILTPKIAGFLSLLQGKLDS